MGQLEDKFLNIKSEGEKENLKIINLINDNEISIKQIMEIEKLNSNEIIHKQKEIYFEENIEIKNSINMVENKFYKFESEKNILKGEIINVKSNMENEI